MDKSWLAGLLEGEGSFIAGPPSAPHSPRISVEMTDLDVIEKVASAFGTSPIHQKKRGNFKPTFSARLRGARAVALMEELRPLMSKRRQEQIDKAVKWFQPRVTKLTPAEISEIQQSSSNISRLAEKYEVSRWTIRFHKRRG
jgi:hypothetical protein